MPMSVAVSPVLGAIFLAGGGSEGGGKACGQPLGKYGCTPPDAMGQAERKRKRRKGREKCRKGLSVAVMSKE